MYDWLTTETVLATILVTSFTSVGLIGLLAATSPRHWFVRMAVVFAVLSPLLFVPAYEPFVAFTIQCGYIVLGVAGLRWWSAQRQLNPTQSRIRTLFSGRLFSVRFSLMAMLQITVLVAVATWIGLRLPALNRDAWNSVLFIGIVGAVGTATGAWLVTSRRKFLAWTVGIACCLLVGAFLAWSDYFVLSLTDRFASWPPSTSAAGSALLGLTSPTWPVKAWFLVPLCIAILTALLVSLYHHAFISTHNRRAFFARATFAALLITIAVCPVLVLEKLLILDPITDTALPDPNGINKLFEAAKIAYLSPFNGNGSFDYEAATQTALSKEVADCAAVYDLVLAAVGEKSQIPIDYSTGDLPDITEWRALARVLAGRARLAELKGRFDDAAKSNLLTIQFGYAIRPGGLLINALVGIGCSGFGTQPLYLIRDKLSANQLKQCIAKLTRLDAANESYETVAYRDRVWCQRAYGWHGRLSQIIDDVAESPDSILFILPNGTAYAFSLNEAVVRLRICELALAEFHQEQNRWPNSLADLVPKYLPAIPTDPLNPTGGGLKYRLTNDSYILYSVGQNGTDDGGIQTDKYPTDTPVANDLRLDVHFGPDPPLPPQPPAPADSSAPDDSNSDPESKDSPNP